MKVSAALAVAFAAVAMAGSNATEAFTTTTVVTAYTTYCPHPTTIVENNQTYTVTEATTLTITNCPCTRTQTYTTVTSTICDEGCPTDAPTDAPTYPNSTVAVPTAPATTEPAPIPSYIAGAGSRFTVASGALAGLVGVAAYLL